MPFQKKFKFDKDVDFDELFKIPVGKCVDMDYNFDEGKMKITVCRVSENESKFKFTVDDDAVIEGKVRMRDM